MAIGDDFKIDYVNKRIYHSGSGTTVYSTNALYSYLIDTFDEQGAMDDTIPMSAQTPTEYTMTNEWFIDDVSTNFLDTGSIKTDGYSGSIQTLKLDPSPYTNCDPYDIGQQVIDDGLNTGSLLAYNNTDKKWWIRGTGVIADNSSMTISGSGTGSGTANGNSITGEDLYADVYTLGTIESGTLIYIYQAGKKIDPDWWDVGHIDVLVKVKEANVETDDAVITLLAHVYTDLYDNYEIDLSAGGRNAVPLATSNDPDNQTGLPTVCDYIKDVKLRFANATLGVYGWTGVTPTVNQTLWDTGSNVGGYILAINSGSGANTGSMSLGDVTGSFAAGGGLRVLTQLNFKTQSGSIPLGEFVSGSTSTATAVVRKTEQLYNGIVTGSRGTLWLWNVTGSFSDNENIVKKVGGTYYAQVTGSAVTSNFQAYATGSATITGSILKDMDNGQGLQPYNVIIDLNANTVLKGYEYVKALTTRTSNFPMHRASGSALLDQISGERYRRALDTYAEKKTSPFGTFAGGKFFGARGVWIEDMASGDVQAYTLIDASGSTQTPPNLQSMSVTSVVSGDRVLICKATGDNYIIDKSQYTNVSQSSGLTYVGVNETIPDDTPSTGVLRVRYNVGAVNEAEDVYTVTSLDKTNKRFNISGTTARAYTTANRTYMPYMDRAATSTTETVTVTYGVDRYLVVRVRKKGIIPFQTKGTYISTGYSVGAIRTTDSIVT